MRDFPPPSADSPVVVCHGGGLSLPFTLRKFFRCRIIWQGERAEDAVLLKRLGLMDLYVKPGDLRGVFPGDLCHIFTGHSLPPEGAAYDLAVQTGPAGKLTHSFQEYGTAAHKSFRLLYCGTSLAEKLEAALRSDLRVRQRVPFEIVSVRLIKTRPKTYLQRSLRQMGMAEIFRERFPKRLYSVLVSESLPVVIWRRFLVGLKLPVREV
jgi:hypothetical protein